MAASRAATWVAYLVGSTAAQKAGNLAELSVVQTVVQMELRSVE